MCLSPIDIINPTKYVSLSYRDRFLLQVPCGKCAECQRQLSNQWFYRTWYEWQDCIKTGGYVYFDTLTYDDEHLPTMREFCSDLPSYPCFRPSDIRKFTQCLRDRLKRVGSSYKYFIVSEYGSLRHRPHYHILLFVHGIDPLSLSCKIDDIWFHGRTDGVSYRGSSYVLSHNVKSGDLETQLAVCHYVSKYVQKTCDFEATIDQRLNSLMSVLNDRFAWLDDCDWSQTVHSKRVYQHFKRLVSQRHWQSQQFGASALSDIDIAQLMRDGVLFMPSPHGVKIPISLPTYYKRKLFQEQIVVHGARHWQLTPLGCEYRDARRLAMYNSLKDRFDAVCVQYHLPFDTAKLVDYVISSRGRINVQAVESTLENRLRFVDFYNYSTMTDRERIGIGISLDYLGNSKHYRSSLSSSRSFSHADFIAHHVIIDSNLEQQLEVIYAKMSCNSSSRQDAHALRQRLADVSKILLSPTLGIAPIGPCASMQTECVSTEPYCSRQSDKVLQSDRQALRLQSV